MNQTLEPSNLFLAVAGLFLLLSGAGLYLLRNVMARTGESAWSGLPEKSKFKTFQGHVKAALLLHTSWAEQASRYYYSSAIA
jgi:hypothetical protein